MSQIHIVIGFKTSSLQSEVVPVYVGRSGVEAEAAIKARTDLAQCHHSRGLPRGVIKRNGNVQPLALPVPAATGPEAQSPSYDELPDALTEVVAHIAELKDQIAATEPHSPDTGESQPDSPTTDATSPTGEAPEAPAERGAEASAGSLIPGRRRK